MINLNKESIKKIKDIDNKADNILKKSDITSNEIVSKIRHELPSLVKQSQESRDKKKSLNIDSSKKMIEENAQKQIQEGILHIKNNENKSDKRIDTASDIALDIFIKKINFKGKD